MLEAEPARILPIIIYKYQSENIILRKLLHQIFCLPTNAVSCSHRVDYACRDHSYERKYRPLAQQRQGVGMRGPILGKDIDGDLADVVLDVVFIIIDSSITQQR